MDNPKTILIIDDSNFTLLLVEWVLQNQGYITNSAASVTEAISFIEKKIPDLILLDLQMPQISGYDFLRMRNELNIRNVPIIIISTDDSNDAKDLSSLLGGADFVPKPININTLTEKVKQYLKK